MTHTTQIPTRETAFVDFTSLHICAPIAKDTTPLHTTCPNSKPNYSFPLAHDYICGW